MPNGEPGSGSVSLAIFFQSSCLRAETGHPKSPAIHPVTLQRFSTPDAGVMDATRLYGEIKRRTNIVGIAPKEAAFTRLSIKQSDGCLVQKAGYLTVESIAPIATIKLFALAACLNGSSRRMLRQATGSYTTSRDTIPERPGFRVCSRSLGWPRAVVSCRE